jgi:hypothetical protein
MLIICHDYLFAPTPTLVSGILTWDAEMQARGIRQSGNPLRPSADAVTVRVRKGATEIVDGPFADTPEHIAAYEIVECPNLETAVEVAASHPMASAGTIEVRPLWENLVGLMQDE